MPKMVYSKKQAFKLKIEETKRMIEIIAKYYGLSYDQLTGKDRSKPVSKVRNIAMYICHEYLDMSFSEIGKLFGDRDITTVIHGKATIEELLSKGDEITDDMKSLIESLNIEI